ncbi:MAG: DUF3685 domain-containing protein [Elainellaceae cyanobacterium]
MTVQSAPPDYPPLRLMLIDEDAAFRSGLRIWLEQFADFQIVAEAETDTAALQILADLAIDRAAAPASATGINLDLVILDISGGQGDRAGLELCRSIKNQYSTLPVLLLSRFVEPVMLAAAQRVGADGYCSRNLPTGELATVIRQVAMGQPLWLQPSQNLEISNVETATGTPAAAPDPFRPINRVLRNLRLSGLRQIDDALARVEQQLQDLDLSDLDRAVLAGQQREMRAARWVVRQLLATPRLDQALEAPATVNQPEPPAPQRPIASAEQPPASAYPIVPSTQASALVDNARDLQALLFDTVSAKLQTGISNGTDIPLEVDILQEAKKRELFYVVLRKLEDLLAELRYSQVQPEQVAQKRILILIDLWQAVTVDFFGKYSMLPIDGQSVPIVDVLLQDVAIVQPAILDKIPGVIALLNHLLFQTPLLVDGVPYTPGNPEALARAEILLENLIIRVASAVMQPLLNRFGNVESIKQILYDRRLFSSREVERFRNNLSWRYRLERNIWEPTDIFESQYSLFVFSGRSIKKIAIYAPRNQELEQLSGVPLLVTLALETRDAVSPRLQSAIAAVGNGVIYVLTEVIGRGIGLIGRGVIKGIGNVWQDSRSDRR